MRIYVDNAATTKMSQEVINSMLPYFDQIYGNPSSLHSEGQIASEALDKARKTISSCIGCNPAEIIFTSGGSESDNQAIISAAKLGEKKGKKHIVSTAIEHHAVLHTLKKLQKNGFDVTLVEVPENGIVKADDIKQAIRDDTCLVSVMYANNEIGTIQPIKQIGELCAERGIIFHTDAVQAVGHIRIDVQNDHIDMLSLSAHKFHGPKGVGALYVRRGIATASIIEGGAQEKGRRAGTENLPSIVGMATALELCCKNINQNSEKLIKLRNKIIDGLSSIPHSVLNGDLQSRLPGNINFCFEGIEGESLLLLLDDKGISASSGSACTSGSLDPSHVLLAIGRIHDIAHGSLRISLSEENTEEEAEYIISSVKEVVEYLRSISPVWRDLQNRKREFVIK